MVELGKGQFGSRTISTVFLVLTSGGKGDTSGGNGTGLRGGTEGRVGHLELEMAGLEGAKAPTMGTPTRGPSPRSPCPLPPSCPPLV